MKLSLAFAGLFTTALLFFPPTAHATKCETCEAGTELRVVRKKTIRTTYEQIRQNNSIRRLGLRRFGSRKVELEVERRGERGLSTLRFQRLENSCGG